MNKAITQGLVLMPPPFSAGLALWSREDGLSGQGSYFGQVNAKSHCLARNVPGAVRSGGGHEADQHGYER